MNDVTFCGFTLINPKYGLFIKLVDGKPCMVGYSHEITLFDKESKARELLPEIMKHNFEPIGHKETDDVQKDMADGANWEIVKTEIGVRFVG